MNPLKNSLHLAFYQPDMPQNMGAAMRLCACLGIGMEVIEPVGFAWKDKEFKRSGMDYINHVELTRHISWQSFCDHFKDNRIILLTTKTDLPYTEFEFQPGDVLLCGSESSGVPEGVHNFCQHQVTIEMHHECRSLNVINAASMIVGEALRQLK